MGIFTFKAIIVVTRNPSFSSIKTAGYQAATLNQVSAAGSQYQTGKWHQLNTTASETLPKVMGEDGSEVKARKTKTSACKFVRQKIEGKMWN